MVSPNISAVIDWDGVKRGPPTYSNESNNVKTCALQFGATHTGERRLQSLQGRITFEDDGRYAPTILAGDLTPGQLSRQNPCAIQLGGNDGYTRQTIATGLSHLHANRRLGEVNEEAEFRLWSNKRDIYNVETTFQSFADSNINDLLDEFLDEHNLTISPIRHGDPVSGWNTGIIRPIRSSVLSILNDMAGFDGAMIYENHLGQIGWKTQNQWFKSGDTAKYNLNHTNAIISDISDVDDLENLCTRGIAFGYVDRQLEELEVAQIGGIKLAAAGQTITESDSQITRDSVSLIVRASLPTGFPDSQILTMSSARIPLTEPDMQVSNLFGRSINTDSAADGILTYTRPLEGGNIQLRLVNSYDYPVIINLLTIKAKPRVILGTPAEYEYRYPVAEREYGLRVWEPRITGRDTTPGAQIKNYMSWFRNEEIRYAWHGRGNEASEYKYNIRVTYQLDAETPAEIAQMNTVIATNPGDQVSLSGRAVNEILYGIDNLNVYHVEYNLTNTGVSTKIITGLTSDIDILDARGLPFGTPVARYDRGDQYNRGKVYRY